MKERVGWGVDYVQRRSSFFDRHSTIELNSNQQFIISLFHMIHSESCRAQFVLRINRNVQKLRAL